jgi:hypothetical protein
LDNTPYDGGASAYIDEEYPEYEYDASDMEYIMQRRDANPNVYKSSLYRQIDQPRSGGLSSLLNRGGSGRGMTYSQPTNLYNYDSYGSSNYESIVFKLVNNPIVLIILVVVIAYAIAYVFGNLLGMDSGKTGLLEMAAALVLSYGLSFYTERTTDFVIKGTFVFFVSLIILIILIFV